MFKLFLKLSLLFILLFLVNTLFAQKESYIKYFKKLYFDSDSKTYKFSDEILKDDLEDEQIYYKVHFLLNDIYQYDQYVRGIIYSTFVFDKESKYKKINKIINYNQGKVYIATLLDKEEDITKKEFYNYKIEELEQTEYYNKKGKKYKISVYRNNIEMETIFLDKDENKKIHILYYEGKKIYYYKNGKIKKEERFRPRDYPF